MVRTEARVMVCPAMAEQLITSPAVASIMACRSEPDPLLLLLATLIVAADSGMHNAGKRAMVRSRSFFIINICLVSGKSI